VGLYVPAQPPLGDVRRLVSVARMMRLDAVMLWDHLQDFFPQSLWNTDLTWRAKQLPSAHSYYDYRTLLGYLAPRAGRTRVGVGVTEIVRQHPVSVAQAAMTLAHMTKRAPILGIGSGERMNTEPYGLPMEKPVGRLEEALQIIRQCFTSQGTFNFQGEHFKLRDAVIDLAPPPGKTPEIWVGAHGPRMLRLTGQYADGWYPSEVFPEVYARNLATIRQVARDNGRDPDAITPSNQISVVVAKTEQEAIRILDSPAGRYIGLAMPARAWEALGAQHPLGANFGGSIDILPESYTKEQLDDAMARVPLEVTREFTAHGTPDQVIARLREFGEAGMRHTVLAIASALASQRAAMYSLRALWKIKRALR